MRGTGHCAGRHAASASCLCAVVNNTYMPPLEPFLQSYLWSRRNRRAAAKRSSRPSSALVGSSACLASAASLAARSLNEWRRTRAAALVATNTQMCSIALGLNPMRVCMSEQLSIDVVGFVCANQRLPNSPATMRAHKRGIRARFGRDCRLRPPAPSPCLCSMVPFAQHALAAVKLCGRRSGACNPWRRVGKADHGSEQIRRGGGDAVLGDD